jgi:putative oxidoreductase
MARRNAMDTAITGVGNTASDAADKTGEGLGGKSLVLLGRVCYALIFVLAGPSLFSQAVIGYAAAHGVPLASILVPISGVLAILGGLSVAVGYKATWGAWLLALFLVPVTLMMHNFWAEKDPTAAQMQQIMFMRNVSMLGGAFLIAYFGAGPLSLDARLKARAEK